MKLEQYENFQVFIKLRPLNQKQKQEISSLQQAYSKKSNSQKSIKLSQNAYNFATKFYGYDINNIIKVQDDTIYVVDAQYKSIDKKLKPYRYNGIFNENIRNIQVFKKAIQKHIQNLFEGYNSTIFTYGITGSGKTHTIFGNNQKQNQDRGICYQSFEYLFKRKQQIQKERIKNNCNIIFKFSFLQIYNQNVKDLLNNQNKSLNIIEDSKGNTIITQLTQKSVSSIDEIYQLLKQGCNKRALAATSSNLYSSRSHAIQQLCLEIYQDDIIQSSAKLYIIDLAGSQKMQPANTAKGIIQGSNINKSLLALGNCINVLAQKKGNNIGHVPYRDSKLTRILKDSLGGNANTLMIACISSNPFTIQETVTTLNYASRANGIQKKIIKNIYVVKQQKQNKQDLTIKKQLQGIKCNLSEPFLCTKCGHYEESITPLLQKNVDEQNISNLSNNINLIKSRGTLKREQFIQEIYQDIIQNAHQYEKINQSLLQQTNQQIKDRLQAVKIKNEKQRIELKDILKKFIQNMATVTIKQPQVQFQKPPLPNKNRERKNLISSGVQNKENESHQESSSKNQFKSAQKSQRRRMHSNKVERLRTNEKKKSTQQINQQ